MFRAALEETGFLPLRDGQVQAVHDGYYREISESHQASKEAGVDFPEVDIITIWHRVLAKTLMADGFPMEITPELLARLSVTYESLSNIACPMPGAKETLAGIRRLGIPLGIVSNAQFYTPLLLTALFDGELESLGFSPNLLFWSYREGRGKPSSQLFQSALEGFSQRGITAPGRIIHVGNDAANDIIPPKTLSLKAALFAGDLRSLKKGEKNPLYSYLKPDAVLTELNQLLPLITSGENTPPKLG